MRGAQPAKSDKYMSNRIIPADAGSTTPGRPHRDSRGDHPRGCGEHKAPAAKLGHVRGSSPRMRGALSKTHAVTLNQGIIPADAGSTPLISIVVLSREDHPRGCGEHLHHKEAISLSPGSSPRMRGARFRSLEAAERSRIIPADAGSTYDPLSLTQSPRDHPRGCGEHVGQALADYSEVVSSPRMRGALAGESCGPVCARIIPADAGSTNFDRFIQMVIQDHPRGCGEHSPSRSRPSPSSWIIPADAGSTIGVIY